MPHTPRIGIQIAHFDPFWVQVREVIWQQAQLRAAELVEIDTQDTHLLTADEQAEVVEDLIVQELDALICNIYPPSLLARILDRGIPIVYVSEIALRHPRFTSRVGLYDAAHSLGRFLDERLGGCGNVLVVGGFADSEDTGQSRLDGFAAALPRHRPYVLHHVPSEWLYDQARDAVAAFLAARPDLAIHAVFGLSDSLALAARDAHAAAARGEPPLVLGINGDPLALAAIAEGSVGATVEIDIDDIATQAVELAHRAARGEPFPPFFRDKQRLVTADNVAEVAMRRLLSLATLPTRLVNVNRRNEQQRVVQRETAKAIDRQVGAILHEHQLSLAITGLIRDNYGFDNARFLRWRADAGQLFEVGGREGDVVEPLALDPAGALAYALLSKQAVFIPDTTASHRFAPDQQWPHARARVVLPVRLGEEIVGLLDLHRGQATHHTRQELYSLQLLADRLGTAMRNAELYGEALAARALAEKADRLKTVLLTNVSHELRTPLHVIMASSHAALARLDASRAVSAPELAPQLRQIYGSGEHLLRLINDLLDLSRAEIGELDLRLRPVELRPFLEQVFQTSASTFGAGARVGWRLALPPELPWIEADPVRLQQILLNLLHNAHKFTTRGEIVLGAALAASELHLWVADTGIGIDPKLHEQVFAPFISVDGGGRQHEGIGLGLSIARRLVALHRGRMAVSSAPGRGSTFHIYLPLPPHALAGDEPPATLLLVTAAGAPPPQLVELAGRRGLTLYPLGPDDSVADVVAARPALVAWDVATASEGGWRTIEQLRAHPQLGQLPLMLYHGGEGEPPAGLSTGLVLKPLGDDELVAALQDLVPHASAGEILIVEDDDRTRAIHCRLIAEHFPGYITYEAGDGRAALAYLARRTPGLIVLDLVMPQVDGFAVLEAVRAEPRTALVPVLVLSGRELSPDDIRRLAQARVVFQAKNLLSESELAHAFRRTLERDAALHPATSALVKRAIAYLQTHYAEPLARQEIADAVGVSKDYLGRIFHQELGFSPWEYLTRYRIMRAKELLRSTDYSVAEVAAHVGFATATYFSHIFHREVGCSPRAFRAHLL